jgi:hypothetical protein
VYQILVLPTVCVSVYYVITALYLQQINMMKKLLFWENAHIVYMQMFYYAHGITVADWLETWV